MAKNKLQDLNDHLFCQLERLNDESLSEESMKVEILKAKSISSVASQIISSAKLTFEVAKAVNQGDFINGDLPKLLTQES